MTVRFSASNADRLMACPASANLELAIPGWTPPVVDPTAGAKGRGTNMHAVIEQATAFTPKQMLGMAEAIRYVAELRQTRRFKVLTEHTFVADWLQSKPTTTVDLVLYVADEIHVIDHKTGQIEVSVHDNSQLLYYAVSAAPLAPKATGVWLHIVQPWAKGNIEKVFVTTAELLTFMREAQAAEKKILQQDTTFGPSEHCKFCPAYPHSRGDKGRPFCPATMKILYPPKVDEQAFLDW